MQKAQYTDSDGVEHDALAYLMQDGNLRVPGGRYGHDTATCAPVAIAVAEIWQESSGDPITTDDLDGAMSLVVNSSDAVLSLIRDHGTVGQRQLIEDAILEDWSEDAREFGRDAARNAATWITDGNDSDESRRRKLELIEDGRLDEIMRAPNLSGEYADDLTSARLYEQITGRDAHADMSFDADSYGPLMDSLSDAYEEGVSERVEDACVAELQRWTGESS
jgi:hypothetical protein